MFLLHKYNFLIFTFTSRTKLQNTVLLCILIQSCDLITQDSGLSKRLWTNVYMKWNVLGQRLRSSLNTSWNTEQVHHTINEYDDDKNRYLNRIGLWCAHFVCGCKPKPTKTEIAQRLKKLHRFYEPFFVNFSVYRKVFFLFLSKTYR